MKSLLAITGLAAVLGLASSGLASVVLTDIQSYSDAGGIWNNDSVPNWAIWMATSLNPSPSNNPSSFLNNNGGSGNLPNTPVTIPDGTHTYYLFKAVYGSADVTDNFIFGSSTLSISPNLAYITTPGTASGTAGPITIIGGEQVSISGFGWYNPNAYSKNYVSRSQGFGPDPNGDNVVASVTFTVTPEPASLGLLGIGGLSLLARRRRA